MVPTAPADRESVTASSGVREVRVGGLTRDVAPVADRMTAFMALRVAAVVLLTVLGEVGGVASRSAPVVVLTVSYLGVGVAMTALCHTPWPRVRTGAFVVAVLADCAYLQYQHARLSGAIPVELAVAAFLVAACLLASFRTGLLMAAVQSVVLVLTVYGQRAGLAPAAPGVPTDAVGIVATLLLIWLVVVMTAAAASLHERELRRSREDAEALGRLAAALHHDSTAEAVAERVVRFGVEDLSGRRVAVVRRHRTGLELVTGHGVVRVPHLGEGQVSSALALAALWPGPTLLPRVDRLRDPWLHAVMPDARGVVLVRLDVGLDERMWLVLERPQRRGRRMERRFVATLSHAAGTISLALDRVRLLREARLRASLDALTGVPNRRALDELLDRLTAAHGRSGEVFSVVMIDVDRFKSINDTLGHQAGDEVLRRVAVTLRAQLRRNETIARYGGEEFAAVLPGTGAPDAVAVAERLRLALHDITDPVPVTASFGVAGVPDDASDGATAMALADAALLRAKDEGRDRVSTAGSGAPPSARPADLPAIPQPSPWPGR
jgi:diguanylate cyclase (GGDEF)-like protein